MEIFDPRTMHMTQGFCEQLQEFKLHIRNRRVSLTQAGLGGVGGPAVRHHEGNLWKLKGDGDTMNEEHWFCRIFWLASNGSLCYESLRDKKGLVYYTYQDLSGCEVLSLDKAAKPFS